MRTRSGRPHVVILDENLPVPLDRRVWQEGLALVGAGFRVTIISPRGAGEMGRIAETRDGILILRYPQRAATGLSGYVIEYLPSMWFTAAWLLALRLRGRIDVIHGCNPPDLFFLLGRLGRVFGARYVFDQHDANPELAVTKWGDRHIGRLLVRLTRALERASYRTAAVVIVPNDSYARLAAERGGLPPEGIVVVRNAPPGDHFRALAAGTLPPDDGGLRIGYLGVMGSQDGVEILLERGGPPAQLRVRTCRSSSTWSATGRRGPPWSVGRSLSVSGPSCASTATRVPTSSFPSWRPRTCASRRIHPRRSTTSPP